MEKMVDQEQGPDVSECIYIYSLARRHTYRRHYSSDECPCNLTKDLKALGAGSSNTTLPTLLLLSLFGDIHRVVPSLSVPAVGEVVSKSLEVSHAEHSQV